MFHFYGGFITLTRYFLCIDANMAKFVDGEALEYILQTLKEKLADKFDSKCDNPAGEAGQVLTKTADGVAWKKATSYDDTKIQSDITNLKIDKANSTWVSENFQPKGNYPTKEEVTQQILDIVTDGQVSLEGYATETWVEGKLKDIKEKIDAIYEKLDKLPFIEIIPDEETYNEMVKEPDHLYLIEGNPSKFTTQDDLDILQNTIEIDFDEKLEEYQPKSQMVRYVDSALFEELRRRVDALEAKV